MYMGKIGWQRLKAVAGSGQGNIIFILFYEVSGGHQIHLSSFPPPVVEGADEVGYNRARSRFPHPRSALEAEPRYRTFNPSICRGNPCSGEPPSWLDLPISPPLPSSPSASSARPRHDSGIIEWDVELQPQSSGSFLLQRWSL